jgi:hypothetical protein
MSPNLHNKIAAAGLLLSMLSTPSNAQSAKPRDVQIGQVRHLGYSKSDQIVDCARRALGKLVVGSTYLYEIAWPDCAQDRSEFLSQARARGVFIFEDGDWVYLAVKGDFGLKTADEYSLFSEQHRIKIVPKVSASEDLSKEEVQDITKKIFQGARIGPLGLSPADVGHKEIVLNFDFLIRVAELAENSPSAIVAQIVDRSSYRAQRLVYGEERKGAYEVLWDSPLVNNSAGVDFEDVDGDGIKEIVMRGELHDAKKFNPRIVIFNKDGKELTRQADCDGSDYFVAEDGTCPIVDPYEVSLTENSLNPAGPKIIRTQGGAEYELVKGNYALRGAGRQNGIRQESTGSSTDTRAPGIESVTSINEQAMQLMKKNDYKAAAAKFEQALAIQFNQEGDRSPRTVLFIAQLANNAGFAYYKMGNYEQCLVSLKQALNYDPKRAVAYFNLGDVYVKLNRIVEARQAYTKYLELVPDSKSALDVKKKLDALAPSP